MIDWRQVMAEHGPTVWRTVYRLLSHHADALDCYQETFLAAYRAAQRQVILNWTAFLTSLATRRAIDCLRQRIRARKQFLSIQDVPEPPSACDCPVENAHAAEWFDRIRAELAHLPEKQAEVFWSSSGGRSGIAIRRNAAMTSSSGSGWRGSVMDISSLRAVCFRVPAAAEFERGAAAPEPRKEAWLGRLPGDPKKCQTFLNALQDFQQKKGVTSGKDTLGERETIRFRCEDEKEIEDATLTTTLWVDAKTKLPVREEFKISYKTGMTTQIVHTDFEWDPELPKGIKNLDELFSTKPPEGYALDDQTQKDK